MHTHEVIDYRSPGARRNRRHDYGVMPAVAMGILSTLLTAGAAMFISSLSARGEYVDSLTVLFTVIVWGPAILGGGVLSVGSLAMVIAGRAVNRRFDPTAVVVWGISVLTLTGFFVHLEYVPAHHGCPGGF
jgi:hypothetical protein